MYYALFYEHKISTVKIKGVLKIREQLANFKSSRHRKNYWYINFDLGFALDHDLVDQIYL